MTAPVKPFYVQLVPYQDEVLCVRHADHERLEQECERLKAANADLQIHFDTMKADRAACWAEFKVMSRSFLDAEKERDTLRAQVEAMRADKAAIDLLNQYIVTAGDPSTGKTVILADSGTLRDRMEAALQAKP